MRNAFLMFGIALLAAVAALAAYYVVVDRGNDERLLARVHEDNELTRHELERMAKEQNGMREVLTKATAMSDSKSVAIRTDFVAATGSMKTAIAEYYLTNGKLPASNAELGLPAPGEYRGTSLKSATVTPQGAIELTFDAASGIDGGQIRLVPDVDRAGAMGIRWRCESADFAQIADLLPACVHTTTPAQGAQSISGVESKP